MVDAAVVWLADGPATPPGDDARRALDAWAETHGVKLVAATDGTRATKAIDWDAAEEAERGITAARDALAGLDFGEAERALGRAEAALRDHPELPQAAFLRAEVERVWSSRWLRANDEARAKQAWQRAAALDGGRAAGLGEKDFEAGGMITATIRIEGDGAARLWLDGAWIEPGEIVRGEGEHALAVIDAAGGIVSTAWVTLSDGATVRAQAPEPIACSTEDTGRARATRDRVVAAGVRCPRWVAAIAEPDAGGATAVRVAVCERESCGAFVEWRIPAAASSMGESPRDAIPPPHARWPAWATWTIAGVGVGAAGTVIAILAATGTFKGAPNETHFVNGGLQIHSF